MHYPKHIAIIPDWNRTWAKENWKTLKESYLEWYQRWMEIMQYVFQSTETKVLTYWAMSTENFKKRSEEEIKLLMTLYQYIDNIMDDFLEQNKINFRRMWNRKWIYPWFKKYLEEREKKFNFVNSDKFFVVLINYWWRDEIVRWINKILSKWNIKTISEQDISDNLDFSWLPNIELTIRTKWDMAQRISWLMLWWIWYSELYFTNKKCPEFWVEDFKKSLEWFDKEFQYRNYWK